MPRNLVICAIYREDGAADPGTQRKRVQSRERESKDTEGGAGKGTGPSVGGALYMNGREGALRLA